jgi:hypothetical protein
MKTHFAKTITLIALVALAALSTNCAPIPTNQSSRQRAEAAQKQRAMVSTTRNVASTLGFGQVSSLLSVVDSGYSSYGYNNSYGSYGNYGNSGRYNDDEYEEGYSRGYRDAQRKAEASRTGYNQSTYNRNGYYAQNNTYSRY